jgi:hypothetical protein
LEQPVKLEYGPRKQLRAVGGRGKTVETITDLI